MYTNWFNGQVLIVTVMACCDGCTTPATIEPLYTDKHGVLFDETWWNDSIIGMLMYYASNTCPDIAYEVHNAVCFTCAPRHVHADGSKQILNNIQQTKTERLLPKPKVDFTVDYYVYADSGRLYVMEEIQDLISVNSGTGHIITYQESPLMWDSKLQTWIALSTKKLNILPYPNL